MDNQLKMVAHICDSTWVDGCVEGLKSLQEYLLENLQPFLWKCKKFLSGLDINNVSVDEDAFNRGHRLGMDLMPDAFMSPVNLDLPISLTRASEDEGLELELDAPGP